MSREIKFRGKRLDNGEWVYGGFMQTPEAIFIIDYSVVVQKAKDGYPTIYDVVEVDPKTVGQYTGLKDENGKEIWEGDIVEVPGANQAMAVMYQPPNFVMKAKTKSGGWSKSWSSFILYYKDNQFQKIIGNVTENPKLLEQE